MMATDKEKLRMKHFGSAVLTTLALAAAGTLAAESINPPTMPQTAPMNKQEKRNLDMVLDWLRERQK